MKLNWGHYIVIAFTLFIAFILYFVFEVQGNNKYDNELVVEEYYKNDARYGDDMVKLQNTERLAAKPTIETTPEGVKITFPENFNPEKITGKVSCYRPSAKRLDFTQMLKLSGPSVLIPKGNLVGGRWDMTLDWDYEGTEYLLKKEIYIE
jgi:hypothetical protein